MIGRSSARRSRLARRAARDMFNQPGYLRRPPQIRPSPAAGRSPPHPHPPLRSRYLPHPKLNPPLSTSHPLTHTPTTPITYHKDPLRPHNHLLHGHTQTGQLPPSTLPRLRRTPHRYRSRSPDPTFIEATIPPPPLPRETTPRTSPPPQPHPDLPPHPSSSPASPPHTPLQRSALALTARGRSHRPAAQATANKATFSRFHDA